MTNNTDLDSGTAAGWSIGLAHWKEQQHRLLDSSGDRIKFQIRGTTQTTTPTPTNNAPEFDDTSLTRSIPENTSAFDNVGAVIPAAKDMDSGDTLTYTMEGTDAASFNFNATTRRITTKTGVTYDFETKSSYSVTIKVEDNNGGSDTVDVTITLTDVNEVSTPTDNLLLSNLGQMADDTGAIPRNAQPFTTGAHAAGYTLTSITLNCGCGRYTAGTVTLHSATRTGTKVADFTAGVDGNSNLVLTPTTAITLSASTTYVIVTANDFTPSSDAWYSAADGAEDSTSATGWIIPDNGYELYRTTESSWVTVAGAKKFRVGGDPIASANATPTVANEIPDQMAMEGTAFTYQFPTNTFNDTDTGDTLSYMATKPDDSTLPTWLSFDATTRTFTGAPATADVGRVSVKVTATDTGSATVSDNFDIVVRADNILVTNAAETLKQSGEAGIVAQTIRTGSNHAGYTISEIDIRLTLSSGAGRTQLKLYRDSGSGRPGAWLATFTNPASLTPGAVNTFTAPANTHLEGNSTYWVQLNEQGGQNTAILARTVSDAQTGAAGWGIGNSYIFKLTPPGAWVSSLNSETISLTVRGSADIDSTAPVFQDAAVDGDTLTLTYSEALDGSSAPAASAFTVIVAGVERNLASSSPVAIDGSTVTLTLMTAVAAGQTVTVQYTAPTGTGANPLQDLSGNAIASDTATRMVTVKLPSVANAIPDQEATAGTAFRYSFPDTTFSPASSGDTLSYRALKTNGTALPAWLTFTAATRTFEGTPAAGDVGTVSVAVTATDPDNRSVSDAFDIVVSADPLAHCDAMDANEIFCGSMEVGLNGSSYGFARGNYGSLSPDSFNYNSANHRIGYLNYDGAQLYFTQDSDALATGFKLILDDVEFSLDGAWDVGKGEYVVDDHGLSWSANDTVEVKIVSVPNAAPTVVNAIPDQTATAGTAFSYQVPTNTFNDTDTGDTLTYSATKPDDSTLPTWLSFDATTRTFTGTPAATDVETLAVKVTATDTSSATISDEFNIVVSAAPIRSPAMVAADWSLKPTDVAAGAKFRLLFLSSTKRDSTATDIAAYNTFVQNRAAAGHADIRAYSAGFRVLGCTQAVDARDNTSTTYTTADTGVPIYWLNGAQAADDYEDFYDGSWDDEANDKNESGADGLDASVTLNRPITGCQHDGTEAFTAFDSRALGSSAVRIGHLNSSVSGRGPLDSSAATVNSVSHPMYGLSEVFQVSTAPANAAPTVANEIPDQTATAGTEFSYQVPADAFSDPDTSDTLSYMATKADDTDLPTWLSFDAATRTFTGTPTAADLGTVSVKVTATDTGSATVSDEFNIVVIPAAPAGFRADAGDGRVRLVWAERSPPINHEYRYVAGASVPADTAWTVVDEIDQSTVLISGLANGTAYAFEVRVAGSGGVGAGAAAAMSATPSAAVCSPPNLGARREVWSATLTVGRAIFANGATYAGYDHREGNTAYGSLSPTAGFLIGGTSYTIANLQTSVLSGDRRNLVLQFVDSRTFPEAVRAALQLHWCSDSSRLDFPDTRYRVIDNHDADWSIYTTREVALSLPANNDATGTPTVTGTAQASETLTAGIGDIADSDGLPATFPGDYAFQWVRVDADGTSNATDITNATANTYTLTATDVGKRVRVRVSFFDVLGGEEEILGALSNEVVSAPMPAVANVLVSNSAEGHRAGRSSVFLAQSFETGTSTDGWTIANVQLHLHSRSTGGTAVSIREDNSGVPGDLVATLTTPSPLTVDSLNTFTAPADTTLDGDETYWVSVNEGVQNNRAAFSATNGFNQRGQAGWSIGDGRSWRTNEANAWAAETIVLILVVNGADSTGSTNNIPTVTNAIPDQPAIADLAFSYQFPANTFNDADAGDTLSYTATEPDDSTLPTWLSFDATTRTFTGTPAASDVETVAVKVTATDTSGATASDDFDIVVNPNFGGNLLVANFGRGDDDFSGVQGSAQGFTAGGHPAGYTLTNIVLECSCTTYTAGTVTLHKDTRAGAKVADFTASPHATGYLVLTPTTATTLAAGTTYVIVTASDFNDSTHIWDVTTDGNEDIGSAANWVIADTYDKFITSTMSWSTINGSLKIRVSGDPKATNSTPTLANEIPDQTAEAGTEFSYEVPANTFDDTDTGDTLTYSATKADDSTLPTWLTFTPGTRTFAGTPTASDAGTLVVKVTATDTGSATVSDEFNIVVSDPNAGICARTEAVRDALLARIAGITDCALVTDAHLAAITGTLSLNAKSITALADGDFDGLTALTTLDLSSNSLTALPADVFDELTALTTLNLGSNSLTALPADVFDGLTALTTLNLASNSLTALRADVFDELAALRELFLQENSLATLPAGVFDKLTALETLYLYDISLTALPADVFDELTALTTLNLSNNSLTALPDGVFDELTALTMLDLKDNSLAALPDDVFQPLTSLSTRWTLTRQSGDALQPDGGGLAR